MVIVSRVRTFFEFAFYNGNSARVLGFKVQIIWESHKNRKTCHFVLILISNLLKSSNCVAPRFLADQLTLASSNWGGGGQILQIISPKFYVGAPSLNCKDKNSNATWESFWLNRKFCFKVKTNQLWLWWMKFRVRKLYCNYTIKIIFGIYIWSVPLVCHKTIDMISDKKLSLIFFI